MALTRHFSFRLVPEKRLEDRLLPPETWLDEEDFESRWRQEEFGRWERNLSGLLPESASTPKGNIWESKGYRIELARKDARVAHLTVRLDVRASEDEFLWSLLAWCASHGLVIVLSGGALCAPEPGAFAEALRRRNVRIDVFDRAIDAES